MIFVLPRAPRPSTPVPTLRCPSGFSVDLDGAPRTVNDPETPNTGRRTGNCLMVDLGAYEYQTDAPINDCNGNFIEDECETADGSTADCNNNGVPDICDLLPGTNLDCNDNMLIDACETADGTTTDCNANLVPDECDVASGDSEDTNDDGIPDECQVLYVDVRAVYGANDGSSWCDRLRRSPRRSGRGFPR